MKPTFEIAKSLSEYNRWRKSKGKKYLIATLGAFPESINGDIVTAIKILEKLPTHKEVSTILELAELGMKSLGKSERSCEKKFSLKEFRKFNKRLQSIYEQAQ